MSLRSIVSYRNLADLSTAIITTNGIVQSNAPLSNLKTRQLSEQAFIDFTGALYGGSPEYDILIDFGAPTTIDVLALLGTNMPTGAYAIGIAYYSSNGISWGFAGTCTLIDLQIQSNYPQGLIFIMDQSVSTTRYYRIAFSYIAAVPGNIYKIGRLWAGRSIPFVNGSDAGWTITANDSGKLDNTRGQQWYEDEGVRTRVLTMPYNGISTAEAWGFNDDGTGINNNVLSFNGMMLECGLTGDMLCIARTDNISWVERTAVYGHLAQMPVLTHAAGANWNTAMTVVEER